ncbi:MAG: GGDEF domain-containing protein [Anaerolineales bacterium]|nr:GGDEF domain-containing protein [Anaerolineales bacterium]
MALVGLAGHAFFIPLFLWLGVRPMAAVNVASCAIFSFCYRLNQRGRPHTALLIGVLEVVTHAIFAVLYTGWESGFHYYILSLTPLIFYSPAWQYPLKITLTALLGLVYSILHSLTWMAVPWVVVDPLQIHFTGILNIFTLFVVFGAVAAYYRLAATTAEAALQAVNQTLDRQARTDPLTHLANRRHMQLSLELAIAEYRRRQMVFSVVLCDIDNFKAFNDCYGHEAGDRALAAVAGLLQSSLRGQDEVARWGGEEFLLLLPGTRLESARLAAERIREKAAAVQLPMGLDTVKITLTFGVAEYAAEPDASPCLQRADTALYQGKHQGKNQVVAAS